MILLRLSAVELLGPLIPVLTVVTLFGSVVVAGLAIYYQDRPIVRKAFIFLFVFCLLSVTLTDLQFLPFFAWHKFPAAVDTDEVRYQIRVVDDAGRELNYDREAPFANDGIKTTSTAKRMATVYDAETNDEVAAYLLQRGREYRETVENGGRFLRPVRFPPHGLDVGWDRIDTTQYGEFVGIRVYEMHYATNEAGTEIVSHKEWVVYEYLPGTTSGRGQVTDEALGSSHSVSDASVAAIALGVVA